MERQTILSVMSGINYTVLICSSCLAKMDLLTGSPYHQISCIDFFLWGHLKSIVYEIPVDSDVELIARLTITAGDLQDLAGVYANIRCSMRQRYEACIVVGSRSLQYLLLI